MAVTKAVICDRCGRVLNEPVLRLPQKDVDWLPRVPSSQPWRVMCAGYAETVGNVRIEAQGDFCDECCFEIHHEFLKLGAELDLFVKNSTKNLEG